MEMTIHLGAFGSIIDSFAASETPGGRRPDLSNLKLTMHMFVFGRGDYIGGVIRMGFTDTLPAGVDELGLAKVIDGKIQAGSGAPNRQSLAHLAEFTYKSAF